MARIRRARADRGQNQVEMDMSSAEVPFWKTQQLRIREIKQFHIVARVVQKSPLEESGRSGQMFWMTLEDPQGAKDDLDLIKCKVYLSAKVYHNFIRAGEKYKFTALLVRQTKREHYGKPSKHCCELSFSAETLVDHIE